MSIIIISHGMKIAIRSSVLENVDTTKDDGFSLSLSGNQEIKFFKLPILTSADDEIKQPVLVKSVFDVKEDQSNTLKVGPPPNIIDTTKMWNGEK